MEPYSATDKKRLDLFLPEPKSEKWNNILGHGQAYQAWKFEPVVQPYPVYSDVTATAEESQVTFHWSTESSLSYT